MYSRIVLLFPALRDLICNINWCLFSRRLKINHDSHEFILESGTVANSNYLKKVFVTSSEKGTGCLGYGSIFKNKFAIGERQ